MLLQLCPEVTQIPMKACHGCSQYPCSKYIFCTDWHGQCCAQTHVKVAIATRHQAV